MEINNLGYLTDLIYHRFDGKILNRGDYIVISSPHNPGYHWGNLLLFKNAPQKNDHDKWVSLFKEEFKKESEVKHLTFGWDEDVEGEVHPFVSDGFKKDFSNVLVATQTQLKSNAKIPVEFRIVKTDEEWEAVIQLQILTREERYPLEEYTKFKRADMTRHRNMSEKGLGNWFGAYSDGKLIGDLGLFVEGKVGRFAKVETHPDFRGKGVCKNLVHFASQFGLSELGAEKLVMVADPDYHAQKIYQSVGYEIVQTMRGLCKAP